MTFSNWPFQSRVGFLMRCDDNCHDVAEIGVVVSIPVGFSDALRPISNMVLSVRAKVSIPVGFSDALRHDFCHAMVHTR